MSNVNPLHISEQWPNSTTNTLTPADTIAQALLVQLRDQTGEGNLVAALSILDLLQQLW